MKGLGIHGIGKEVSEKLTIEHFYTEVDSKKFIDDLSAVNVLDARENYQSKEFIAKPFIRSFEYALETLQSLQVNVKERIKELEEETRNSEQKYNEQIEELSKAFEEVNIGTQNLETQIGEVGNTAIQIGQQLESIDNQRSRCIQARDLYCFFLDFYQLGQCHPLEDMRSVQGAEGQYKAAIIARKLSNISKEIDFPGMDKTRTSIDKYNENLERDLLETFETSYMNGDISTMASCAKTLFDFNGGNSCMQAYINQHEFFMSQRKLRESTFELAKNYNESNYSNIDDPNELPPPPDPWMVKLYGEVRGVVAKEWDIISKVFPNALFVIRQFLERIFNQSIDQYLDGLLDKAERQSPLAYLRTLASTHSCTSNLVADLKIFDRQFIYTHLQRMNKKRTKGEVIKGIGGDSSANQGYFSEIGDTNLERGYTEVSNIAERWLEEFFIPRGYYENEQDFLKGILPKLIEPYFLAQNRLQEIKNSAKPSMFARFAIAADRMGAINANPNLGGPPNAHPLSPQPRGNYNQIGLNNEENYNQETNNNLSRPATVTLADTVVKILFIHGEVMGRCAELSPPSDLHSYANKLFTILVDFLSQRFLDNILRRELNHIVNREGRHLEIDETLKTFRLVDDVSQVMQLLQRHFEFAILPLVSSSPPAYREVVIKKNGLMSMLETSINQVLHAETSQILGWVQKELYQQNRNSYKISGDAAVSMEALSMPTETCRKCVEVLKKVFKGAKTSLKGANLRAYFIELGTGIHSLLLEHFKKFTVTRYGGILLSLDISQYQGLIRDLKVESLTSRYELLREIADLFIMDNPASIPSLLSSGMLKDLDTQSLYPYLRCRDDFYIKDLPRLLGIRPESFNTNQDALNLRNHLSGEGISLNSNQQGSNNGYETGALHYVTATATAAIGGAPRLGPANIYQR